MAVVPAGLVGQPKSRILAMETPQTPGANIFRSGPMVCDPHTGEHSRTQMFVLSGAQPETSMIVNVLGSVPLSGFQADAHWPDLGDPEVLRPAATSVCGWAAKRWDSVPLAYFHQAANVLRCTRLAQRSQRFDSFDVKPYASVTVL
jgi:hypothetical protein